MKVPLSWLREFIDIDLATDELVDVMGRSGLEVDGVRHPGAGTDGVLAARVLSWVPHPDADKLRVVQVDNGSRQIEVVCGASNFDVGDMVAHAGVGASIPSMTMTAKELRGVVSHGMLCSSRELQVGDDHDGIMVLGSDVAPGTAITDLFPLGEPVIDIEVLADRGDHHSILGVARELSAILEVELRLPTVATTDVTGPVRIELDDPAACQQFATWTLGNVEVRPSPWSIRMRLAQCGVRAISNVVDVTNYVMLELGQPLHAYDLARLGSGSLGARFARPGERLRTLDDQDRELDPRDVVVTGGDVVVGLAGVMGGKDTEVTTPTTSVVFEAATWDPSTVRATSLRLGLQSEAAMRFARRVDPAGARRACGRVVELLRGAESTITDLGTNHAGRDGADHVPVECDPAWVRRLVGLDALTDERQRELLERAGCSVEARGEVFAVTAPSWRGDLGRPADLAEEVARLHGYDQIPASLPHTGVKGVLSAEQRAERRLRAIAAGHGFDEAVTRPFVGDHSLEGVWPGDEAVVLSNPLAQDAGAMRTSLVEGLLGAVRRNVGQGRPGIALYEYGRIFRRSGGPMDAVLAGFGDAWRWTDPEGNVLPTQPRAIALAAQGPRTGPGWLATDRAWSVFELLAVLDALVADLAPNDDPEFVLERRSVERDGFHPGRSAALHLRGHQVGFVGQLHPHEADRRDLPEPVVVAELLIEPLLDDLGAGRPPRRAAALVRHPALSLDVALVADESVAYATLADAVRTATGTLLDGLWLFDEYRGDQVGTGRRSVAMRLRLQSPERQLTDDDAAEVLAAIDREAQRVDATLRR